MSDYSKCYDHDGVEIVTLPLKVEIIFCTCYIMFNVLCAVAVILISKLF